MKIALLTGLFLVNLTSVCAATTIEPIEVRLDKVSTKIERDRLMELRFQLQKIKATHAKNKAVMMEIELDIKAGICPGDISEEEKAVKTSNDLLYEVQTTYDRLCQSAQVSNLELCDLTITRN